MTTDAMLYPHRHLPNGCECNLCAAEARRDAERRDRALAAVIYELGVESLRMDALRRVPSFSDSFGGA